MTPLASPAPARPGSEGSVDLELHGVHVRVTSDRPDLLDGIRGTWGRLADARAGDRTDAAVRRTATISIRQDGDRMILGDEDGQRTVTAGELPLVALFDRVVHAFNRGLDREGILAVHAGAVEIDGLAVILAGPSGRGKSTLVVELVRGGAGLLSDECALVASDNRTILAYPRALHLRPHTVELIAALGDVADHPRRELGGGSEVAIGPDRVRDLLGGRLSDEAPLGGVLVLGERLAPDASPRIDPIQPAIAVMELLRGTTSASWNLDAARNRLIDVVGGVPCGSLRAGRLAATGALVAAWARGTR